MLTAKGKTAASATTAKAKKPLKKVVSDTESESEESGSDGFENEFDFEQDEEDIEPQVKPKEKSTATASKGSKGGKTVEEAGFISHIYIHSKLNAYYIYTDLSEKNSAGAHSSSSGYIHRFDRITSRSNVDF